MPDETPQKTEPHQLVLAQWDRANEILGIAIPRIDDATPELLLKGAEIQARLAHSMALMHMSNIVAQGLSALTGAVDDLSRHTDLSVAQALRNGLKDLTKALSASQGPSQDGFGFTDV